MRRLVAMLALFLLVFLTGCTPYPASERPDHIILTWSDDPRTTQTVQWRTGMDNPTGVVFCRPVGADAMDGAESLIRVVAHTERIDTPETLNDPIMYRHTAVLTDLDPGTAYAYAVGHSLDGPASEWATFTTAPNESSPFSFVYFGDFQNGQKHWQAVLEQAHAHRPDAAFYVIAGDLVDAGSERHQWDIFFEYSQAVFGHRPVVPALGNHEYQGGEPKRYSQLFALPDNGPAAIPSGRAYSFEYSNALFIVLDSNLPAETQTDWMEEQLATTTALWKFVVYHHPAYSSAIFRSNSDARKAWVELFDTYQVDMALQGHDHGYMRTYPMRNGKRVGSPAEGTLYVVAVTGNKFYWQGNYDYAAVTLSYTSTYQVIEVDGNRLTYRAYDRTGRLQDEVLIEK